MAQTRTNLAGWSDDDFERGQNVPDGWYVATLEDADDSGEDGALRLTFKVAAGEHADFEITQPLWDPSGAKDRAGEKKAAQRIGLFAKRLGVLPPPEQRTEDTVIDWSEALGKRVAIKVKNAPGKRRDGSETVYCQLDWAGVYELGRPEIPPGVEDGQPAAPDAPGRGTAQPEGGFAPAAASQQKPAAAKPANGKPTQVAPAGAASGGWGDV